ncbi:MAG: HAMP domain-containing histidine kinase [Fibrobacterales bacterium]
MKQGWHTSIHITLYTLAMGMTITLLVLWNVYLVSDYDTVKELLGDRYRDSTRWIVLALGCTFFAVIMMVISIYFASIVRNKRFLKLQQHFVNLTTHELKTPLSNILLFSQTIMDRNPPKEKTEEFVQHIYAEATYLSEIVSKLLEARVVDNQKSHFSFTVMNLKEVLHQSMDRYKREYTLTIPDYISIAADSFYFPMTISNILANADKYAPDGRIDIKATITKRQCKLTISDQGPGLPEKELKKIFNRFYQTKKVVTRYKRGVGLGLFLVKEIVRMHKGTVRAYNNTQGNGLTIEITLPMVTQQ